MSYTKNYVIDRMNYDEDDINEQIARSQYDDMRDLFAQHQNAEVQPSPNLIAWAISDSLDFATFLAVMAKLKNRLDERTEYETEKAVRLFTAKSRV
jgi:hypothetical protein